MAPSSQLSLFLSPLLLARSLSERETERGGRERRGGGPGFSDAFACNRRGRAGSGPCACSRPPCRLLAALGRRTLGLFPPAPARATCAALPAPCGPSGSPSPCAPARRRLCRVKSAPCAANLCRAAPALRCVGRHGRRTVPLADRPPSVTGERECVCERRAREKHRERRERETHIEMEFKCVG